MALARHAGPVAQLFRPGRADHRGSPPSSGRSSSSWCHRTTSSSWWCLRTCGGNRLAGRHHRRVLADAPGHPARLSAAHGDPAHLGDTIGQIYIPTVNWILMGASSPWWWASARRARSPAPMASPSRAPCWSMRRWPWRWRSWSGAGAGRRRPGVRPARRPRPRLLHRQRAEDPRRRLAATGRDILHLLHHHHLAAGPRLVATISEGSLPWRVPRAHGTRARPRRRHRGVPDRRRHPYAGPSCTTSSTTRCCTSASSSWR